MMFGKQTHGVERTCERRKDRRSATHHPVFSRQRTRDDQDLSVARRLRHHCRREHGRHRHNQRKMALANLWAPSGIAISYAGLKLSKVDQGRCVGQFRGDVEKGLPDWGLRESRPASLLRRVHINKDESTRCRVLEVTCFRFRSGPDRFDFQRARPIHRCHSNPSEQIPSASHQWS